MLLITVLSASCAHSGDEQPTTVHIAGAPGVPALRVIAPNGARSLLIGSLHEAAEGLHQPAASVFAGARHYVVEGVPEKTGAKTEMLPQRAPWTSFLTASQISEARRRARCIEQLRGLAPQLADAVVEVALRQRSAQQFAGLAIYRCAPQGLRSRDALLGEAAAAHGLPATPLETQLAAQKQRDAVPEEIYVAMAYDAFRSDGDEALRRAVNALNLGDFEAVEAATRSASRSPEFAQTYYDIMVAQRNLAWMEPLQRLLDDGDAVIVVGASHLAGPQGLPRLLKAAGYTVTPTDIPAAP